MLKSVEKLLFAHINEMQTLKIKTQPGNDYVFCGSFRKQWSLLQLFQKAMSVGFDYWILIHFFCFSFYGSVVF